VVHLDDLLLRRVRLGLLLPPGGKAHLSRIRATRQGELGWDDARWEREEERYLALVRTYSGLPDPAAIPDWHQLLAAARKKGDRGAVASCGCVRQQPVSWWVSWHFACQMQPGS
jgi:hypothetical protein